VDENHNCYHQIHAIADLSYNSFYLLKQATDSATRLEGCENEIKIKIKIKKE
jgi:hypothetical protein